MATIKSQLQLTDGMSAVLSKINSSMMNLLNNFETMQVVSGNAVNLSNLQETRSALIGANQITEEMTRNLRETGDSQQRFNRTLHNGTRAADGLLDKVKNIAVTVMTMAGIKQVLGLSDQLTSATARLNLIVDDGGSVQDLQNKIFASVQESRGDYIDTMQTISKLGILAGDSFSGNDEMIRFAELMNKNFVVAGASAQEQSSAMYQLTQAMASGRLQGDEYRSILENAPLLASSIEDYMRASGVEGTMKEWAADGLLTAEIIKNALFASADEVESRFASIPMTWSQTWILMKDQAIQAFEPILSKINGVANTPKFQNMVDGIVGGMYAVAEAAGWAFEIIGNLASSVCDNWYSLGPLVWGAVAALTAYNAVLGIGWLLTLKDLAGKFMHSLASASQTAATIALTFAQQGLNAALAMCPLTWIIMLVIALIAVFYAVTAEINRFAGTSLSATGMVCGAFLFVLATIANAFIDLYNVTIAPVSTLIYNVMADLANFLGNLFTDPIGAICRLFFGLADTVLSVLQSLASAIDAIFGSNLSGAVQGWRDSLGGWVDETFGQGKEIMAKVSGQYYTMDTIDAGAAYSIGDTFGRGLESSVGDLFNFDAESAMPGFDLSSIIGNTDAIAGNTGASADALKTSTEDLKYMRDMAEQEVINRFTTAEVKIDMTGMTNRIDSAMDIDGVISTLATGFADAVSVAAEGVHA